jgi:serine protease Do
VTFDYGQPAVEAFREGQQFIRFYQYPKIALVEPSSPAERAGVLVGDTLLALNGTDVRKEISLTRLLVPDSRIKVRVRRDGDDRDLNVTVLEEPEYYARRDVPLPRTPRATEQPQRLDIYAPGMPRSSQPSMVPRVWIITEGVAGARLQTRSEGLGKNLGVKQGVLVLGVTPGPAYMAGVREGDVILKADGRTVASVRALQEILESADTEDGVKLVIMREKKQKTLTLRWR